MQCDFFGFVLVINAKVACEMNIDVFDFAPHVLLGQSPRLCPRGQNTNDLVLRTEYFAICLYSVNSHVLIKV